MCRIKLLVLIQWYMGSTFKPWHSEEPLLLFMGHLWLFELAHGEPGHLAPGLQWLCLSTKTYFFWAWAPAKHIQLIAIWPKISPPNCSYCAFICLHGPTNNSGPVHWWPRSSCGFDCQPMSQKTEGRIRSIAATSQQRWGDPKRVHGKMDCHWARDLALCEELWNRLDPLWLHQDAGVWLQFTFDWGWQECSLYVWLWNWMPRAKQLCLLLPFSAEGLWC